jgi:2-amino-4-deoxychorismate synthase
VHALRGPGFGGVQFHPESVLSVGGAGVVRELLGGPAAAGTSPFVQRRPAL